MPAPAISPLRRASTSARMSTMGAARHVDEDRVALHLRDGCGVDHFARFVSQRAMQADHVADGQQILQTRSTPTAISEPRDA